MAICVFMNDQQQSQIPWAKMLDPTGAAAFVGTAVASDEFGRCASGSGGGGGRSLTAMGPKKMMQVRVDVWGCGFVLGCAEGFRFLISFPFPSSFAHPLLCLHQPLPESIQ